MEPLASPDPDIGPPSGLRTHDGEGPVRLPLPEGPPTVAWPTRALARTRLLRSRGRDARATRSPQDLARFVEEVAQQTSPRAPASLPPRVLVIDEDTDLLLLARGVLGGDGYLVDTAGDAVDGLLRALRFPPDAIVLNVRLGGHYGLEVFATLRQHARTTHVPVLALAPSSPARAPELSLLQGLGFAGLVPRPIDWHQLRCLLRQLTGQHSH